MKLVYEATYGEIGLTIIVLILTAFLMFLFYMLINYIINLGEE